MKISCIFIFLSILFLVSCSQNKEFKSNLKKEITNEFLTKDSNLSTTSPIDNWWFEFDDETLNQLIVLGLKNNKDIQIANLAIVTSRQLNKITASTFIPSGSANTSRQRFSSPGFGPNGVSYDLFQTTLDASWELDFFGKNLDRYKAGKLRFLKEMQLYKATNLRIASEIAQNYIELKSLEKQILNLEKISEIRKNLSEIAIQKEKSGTASKINVHNAEINFNNSLNSVIEAKINKKILTYKLAVLIGETPEKILEILSNQSKKQIFDYYSGITPVGLKSDMLKRRPDIIAAEYEIDATLYDKSAQFKEFFPSFTLTAKVGGGSRDLGEVLKKGTNVKDIRGGISLPIFSLGQLSAEYKISKAKAKIAVLEYEKTILNALEETESQLTRYINSLQIEINSNHAWQASNKILQINENKKRLGVIGQEEFLSSKINNLSSEIQLAQKKLNSLNNLILLHKVIGGGFEGYKMKFEKDRVLWVDRLEENKNK